MWLEVGLYLVTHEQTIFAKTEGRTSKHAGVCANQLRTSETKVGKKKKEEKK